MDEYRLVSVMARRLVEFDGNRRSLLRSEINELLWKITFQRMSEIAGSFNRKEIFAELKKRRGVIYVLDKCLFIVVFLRRQPKKSIAMPMHRSTRADVYPQRARTVFYSITMRYTWDDPVPPFVINLRSKLSLMSIVFRFFTCLLYTSPSPRD